MLSSLMSSWRGIKSSHAELRQLSGVVGHGEDKKEREIWKL